MKTKSLIRILQDEQDKKIVLESEDIKVLIDPQTGGKIRSLFSKRTQTEFFYVDPRGSLEAGNDYTNNHDISGYDECFPTVGPCIYPDGKRKGMHMGDHGYLWQGPWEARIDNDRVIMSKDISEFQCRFERTCYLDSACSLRLDSTLTNYGDEPLKYIYSAHPLLAGGEDARLVLPKEVDKMFVFWVGNVPGLSDNTWIKWPPSDKANLQPPYSVKRESAVKLFCPMLENNRVAIHRMDVGKALQFEFDTTTLKYLGVYIQQGYNPDKKGHSKGEILLALEPTSGIGDDLSTCESTGTLQKILPGKPVRFWIKLTVVDL